jgi:uncharacterized protein (TIGR03435 family)
MFLRRILVLCAAIWLGLVVPLIAQSLNIPSQPSTTHPAFDVVSIKPAKPNTLGSSSGFQGETFTASNTTLSKLIQYEAYGIPGPRIIGIPPSLSTAAFDIEAKADPSIYRSTQPVARGQDSVQMQMVQQLLADRFKLIVHSEMREIPIYVLVIAKGGPKLCVAKDANHGPQIMARKGHLEAQGVTTGDLVSSLTRVLSNELGRIVVDKTNLTGAYDLTLNWAPDISSPGGEPDASAPSIFTAVQEQLGLKLESVKGPVSVLVVDHAQMPSQN